MFEKDLLFREIANINREFEVPTNFKLETWDISDVGPKKKGETESQYQKRVEAGKKFKLDTYRKMENEGFKNPEEWFKNFTSITFLGRKFNAPIHIEFAKHLKIVEKRLAQKYGNNDPGKAGDVLQLSKNDTIKGGRRKSGTAAYSKHTLGLAMDINYHENPYLGGPVENKDTLKKLVAAGYKTSGEQSSQRKIYILNNIFNRMGLLINGVKASYPGYENGGYKPYRYERRMDLYDRLYTLNELTVKYFNLTDNQSLLRSLLENNKSTDWQGVSLDNAIKIVNLDFDWFRSLVSRYYTGKVIKDPKTNKPIKEKDLLLKKSGFLKLDRRLVEELELDWGATYGDMMHFDMRNKLEMLIKGTGQKNNSSISDKKPSVPSIKSASSPKPSSGAKSSSIYQNAFSRAVLSNRIYGKKIGWYQYINQINDLLLPYSGLSNVSLGEEAFAAALKEWQKKQGLGADGVLGPGTWTAIKQALRINGSKTTTPAPVSSSGSAKVKINHGGTFKKYKDGWKAFGGGRIKDKLQELQRKGFSITDTEIEIFSILSEKESGGLVSVVNSWDDAYMSMGFFQFPVKVGKLQKVIELAPEAFRKHGIELDPTRRYPISPNAKNNPIAIKNALNISDLRLREWAERFYKAGLEDDVIIAQIKVGRKIFYEDLLKKNDPQNYLDRFKNSPPNLWAFIFEADNSRPAPFREALRAAIKEAQDKNINDYRSFAQILIRALKISTGNFYAKKKYDKNPLTNEIKKRDKITYELGKIERIIEITGVNKV